MMNEVELVEGVENLVMEGSAVVNNEQRPTPNASGENGLEKVGNSPAELEVDDMDEDDDDESGNVLSFVKPTNELMFGTRCWKCYIPNTWFTCGNCDKRFHRKCALLKEGLPPPMRPSKNGATSESEKVCLGLIVACQRSTVMKARGNSYKSIEAYYCDYKKVRYDIIVIFGEESEPFLVVQHLLRVVAELINELQACPTCYINRIRGDATGNFKGIVKSNVKLAIMDTCEKPHLLCWLKMPSFPYWPAKILDVTIINNKSTAILVRFDENQYWNIPLDSKLHSIKTYSRKYPSKYPQSNSSFSNAVRDCEKYIENARKVFGRVVIPETATIFSGDLDSAEAEMFPDFGFGAIAEP